MPDVDALVADALASREVPGLAVGIVADRQVFVRGYGEGIDGETRFGIGSCTKAFITHVFAQLVEEGQLDWDDPVVQHLPEFRLSDPNLTAQLTIRDLLAHRSGLAKGDEMWYAQQLSRTALLDSLATLEPEHELRETFSYNNMLYAVAGMVIERVSGETWEKAIHRRLFLPLEMSASTCSPPTSPNTATPHALIDNRLIPVPPYHFTQVGPAGGIFSSATDMIKWVEVQLSDSPLIQQLHTPQIDISDAEAYCFGWVLRSQNGHSVLDHKGRIDGYCARVSLLPETHIGLILLTNSSADGFSLVTDLGDTLLDTFSQIR